MIALTVHLAVSIWTSSPSRTNWAVNPFEPIALESFLASLMLSA